MKKWLLSLCVGVLSVSFMPVDVQAKRLGGGSSSGLKRQTPPPQPAQAVPAKPATAATPAAAGAAAATPPKRSWMGPLAGLAAGLGIAALLSHFGLGGAMGDMLTVLLLAVAAAFVVRFLFKRFGPGAAQRATTAAPQGLQFAGAGGPSGAANAGVSGATGPGFGSGGAHSVLSPAGVGVVAPIALPPGFDAAEFERAAKLIFIRMQAANDAGNLNDLREFATPEMFATFRLELQERQGAVQQTDVVQLAAQLLDFAKEAERQVVSVRFHGLIREEKDGVANPFDEVWHLIRPLDGSREWAIAGIAQSAVA